MPFMANLNLPDLRKLINDPTAQHTTWPAMPTKIPSDIPKFEGKPREDTSNHVMTYPLWFLFGQIPSTEPFHVCLRVLTNGTIQCFRLPHSHA